MFKSNICNFCKVLFLNKSDGDQKVQIIIISWQRQIRKINLIFSDGCVTYWHIPTMKKLFTLS